MTSLDATDTNSPPSPAHLYVELEDKTHLQIRLVTPRDRAHLVDGFGRLSRQSRYTRFFSYIPSLQGPVLDRLADLSGYLHVAVGAFAENDDLGHGLAIARAIQPSPGAAAELAITVVDGAQGQGLGELLLHVLVALSANLGVTSFTATTLSENRPAAKVFRKIGATTRTDPQDASITMVSLDSGNLAALKGWPPSLDQKIRLFVQHTTEAIQTARTLHTTSSSVGTT
jgi:GNAT superfamily N-acetyltransferase